jgi:hypothetical protein
MQEHSIAGEKYKKNSKNSFQQIYQEVKLPSRQIMVPYMMQSSNTAYDVQVPLGNLALFFKV